MIWLSPSTGTEESSVYFDIRDVKLKYHGDWVSGEIRGLIGDGAAEIWGEVVFGAEETARLLPWWREDGEIESLAVDIDEALLLRRLLEETKLFLRDKGLIASAVTEKDQPRRRVVNNAYRERLAA